MSSTNKSTVERLLEALLSGFIIDITPKSRVEAYLKACLDGSSTGNLPTPLSTVDAYLYALAKKLSAGGGGDDSGDTENSKGAVYKTATVTDYEIEGQIEINYMPLLVAGKKYYIDNTLFTAEISEDEGYVTLPVGATFVASDGNEYKITVHGGPGPYIERVDGGAIGITSVTFYEVVGEDYTETLETPIHGRDPSGLFIGNETSYHGTPDPVYFNFYVDGDLALSTTNTYPSFDEYVPADGKAHTITITASSDGYTESEHSTPYTVYYDSAQMWWTEGQPAGGDTDSPVWASVDTSGMLTMQCDFSPRWYSVQVYDDPSMSFSLAENWEICLDGTADNGATIQLASLIPPAAYPSNGETVYIWVKADNDDDNPTCVVTAVWNSEWESNVDNGEAY